jgi:hypothetical protein
MNLRLRGIPFVTLSFCLQRQPERMKRNETVQFTQAETALQSRKHHTVETFIKSLPFYGTKRTA